MNFLILSDFLLFSCLKSLLATLKIRQQGFPTILKKTSHTTHSYLQSEFEVKKSILLKNWALSHQNWLTGSLG